MDSVGGGGGGGGGGRDVDLRCVIVKIIKVSSLCGDARRLVCPFRHVHVYVRQYTCESPCRSHSH
jgi:hypothetical protein